MTDRTATRASIQRHIEKNWPNGTMSEHQWGEGPVSKQMPDLTVVQVVLPDQTVYSSCGAFTIATEANYRLEFVLLAPAPDPLHIELVSMVAYMHRDPGHHLDVGHTMSIGRPWLPGSTLSRLLVSLPYFAGPEFEILHAKDDTHVRFLWLIPITESEERFRHQYGLEELEACMEEAGTDYLDPFRHDVLKTRH